MKRENFIGFLPFYLLVAILFIGIAHGSSAAVTTVAQSAPVRREHTIIVDAGHGGVDGGATSCSGILEKHLNLEIALRLNDLLQMLGMQTKMIRTMDTSIHTEGETIAAKKVSDLKHRVQIANNATNGILVSIHQNTYPSSQYSGAQVFFGPQQGSETLAKQLQNRLIATVNSGSSREPKKASGIYLLQNIKCPGVLIECGFISNPEEEARLRTAEYQKKLCSIIATEIGRFLLDSQTND